MDNLNIQRNLFLEKEELTQFQTFLQNINLSNLIQSSTGTFGIVPQKNLSGDDFLVEVGTNTGTVKISNDSYAIDDQFRLIVCKAIDNIPIPAQDTYYWLKVSYRQIKFEEGTVSVTASGQLSGVGTSFESVLRGQQTGKPTKIKFYNENKLGVESTVNNTGVYEVVSVLSDTSAILSGNFSVDSSVKYIVVGAYTNGTVLSVSQKAGVYNYDACLLEWVIESVVDTAPTTGYTEDEDFYIARVYWNSVGSVVTVTDKREDYWTIKGLNNSVQTVTGSFTDLEIEDDTTLVQFSNAQPTTDPEQVFLPNVSTGDNKRIILDFNSMNSGDSSSYDLQIRDYNDTVTYLTLSIDGGSAFIDEGCYEFIYDGSNWYYFKIR